MKKVSVFIATLALTLGAHVAAAGDTIKLAYIDALSGPFEDVGKTALHHFEFAVDRVNAQGGVLNGKKFEIIAFDSRGSARSTRRYLREAIDRGARIILQGNSSHVANDLTEAIARKNAQQPDDPVLFLNFSAADPALTNEKCNFWHFRFDPHADMKVAALVKAIAAHDEIKRVYMINQDYSFGHAVAETASRLLATERSDIEIVANVFHPVGVVEDFGPYAEQIAQVQPDAIITGNWGTDIYRLVFAMDDLDLMTPMYTVFGGGAPISTVIGERGNDRILLAHGGVYNPAPEKLLDIRQAFQRAYPADELSSPRIITVVEFLTRALEEVGSLDIAKIAYAMEGMEFETVTGNTVRMRPADHQIIEPVRISAQSNTDIDLAMDDQGFGMKTVSIIDSDTIDRLPTSCRMDRPGGIALTGR